MFPDDIPQPNTEDLTDFYESTYRCSDDGE